MTATGVGAPAAARVPPTRRFGRHRASPSWVVRACQLAIPLRIPLFQLAGLALAALRAACRAIGLASRRPRDAVLYVARNGLGILHIIENARLLSERTGAACVVTGPPWLRHRVLDHARAAGLPIRFAQLPSAIVSRWRLVVHTHHYLGFGFDRASPSVYISHGIETGKKTLYDASYTYGCQGLRTLRQPLYRAMVATHAAELDLAGRAYPAFRDVVTTSTEAVLERLLARRAERASIRKRLGVPRGRPMVLLMSTWGHPSLVSTHGHAIVREIPLLHRNFDLFLAVHPKRAAWPGRRAVLGRLAAGGMTVLPPASSWIDHMAAADVAVSDITSMCLYAALLGLPVVFLGESLERLVAGGLVEELVRRSPRARHVGELPRLLRRALHHPDPSITRDLRRQFPYAGDADHLVRTLHALAVPASRPEADDRA